MLAPSLNFDPDLCPCFLHGFRFSAARTIKLCRDLFRHSCRVAEIRSRAKFVAQRHVPNVTGPLPSVTANLCGREVESSVRNARVEVDAPVVLARVDIVPHVRLWWIFSVKTRVFVVYARGYLY